MIDYINEKECFIKGVPDREYGFGGDIKYGLEYVEENKESFINAVSQRLDVRDDVIAYTSFDGATGPTLLYKMLQYNNEIGFSHVFWNVPYPPKSRAMNRVENMKLVVKLIDDFVKKEVLIPTIYSTDHAKLVYCVNSKGMPVTKNLINAVSNGEIYKTFDFNDVSQEHADYTMIKAFEPILDILLGGTNCREIDNSASLVDIADILRMFGGGAVIPSYLAAKSTSDVAKRLECFDNSSTGAFIASTLMNSLAPFPSVENIREIIFAVTLPKGSDFGYLLDEVQEYVELMTGISKRRVDMMVYTPMNSHNYYIQSFGYIVVKDFRRYFEENVLNHICGGE
jgi:hypothetical protein